MRPSPAVKTCVHLSLWIAFGLVICMSAPCRCLAQPTTQPQKSDPSISLLSLAEIQKRADSGDVRAETELGSRYMDGRGGVQADYAQAMAWFRKAAEQGDAVGENNLAFIYKTGKGVPVDYAQALSWFRKSADQGNDGAELNLGAMYENGEGVPQDYQQAAFWYRRAADQGIPVAQNNLGYMYENGLGMPVDYARALGWYQKAADQGYAEAQNNVGYAYEKGLGVPLDYGQAAQWYRRAVDQGNAHAENNIGYMYEHGLGVPEDYAQAIAWFNKAAALGNPSAENALGDMYDNGHGVARDYGQAVIWYRKAADQGFPVAENNLGFMYAQGQGVEKDYNVAVFWFKKAIAAGNSQASQNLAVVQKWIAGQAAQQQAAAQQAAAQQVQQANDDQANEAAQNQQETQDKIDSLNQEIETLESEKQNEEQLAERSADYSNCSSAGYGTFAAIGEAGCRTADEIAESKARRDVAQTQNKIDDDRAEIERLQGEEVQQRPHQDASFAGALNQVAQENGQTSIQATANQQAANMVALGAANDAARAQAAAAQRVTQLQAEQQAAAQQSAQEAAQTAPSQRPPNLPTGCITVSESAREEANFGNWVFNNNCGVRVAIVVIAPPNPHVTGNSFDVYLSDSLDAGESLRGPQANQPYKYFACPSPFAPYDSATSAGNIVNPSYETNRTVCLQVDASGDILAR